jgi:hypothetical protein
MAEKTMSFRCGRSLAIVAYGEVIILGSGHIDDDSATASLSAIVLAELLEVSESTSIETEPESGVPVFTVRTFSVTYICSLTSRPCGKSFITVISMSDISSASAVRRRGTVSVTKENRSDNSAYMRVELPK